MNVIVPVGAVMVVATLVVLFFQAQTKDAAESNKKKEEWEQSRRNGLEELRALFLQPKPIRTMFNETRHLKGQKTVASGYSNGAFFLVIGGYESKHQSTTEPVNRKETSVVFTWGLKNNDNDDKDMVYVVSKVPLQKVRLMPSGDDGRPMVKFSFNFDPNESVWYTREFLAAQFERDKDAFMERFLNYVIISCSEKEWPQDIALPFTVEHVKELKAGLD